MLKKINDILFCYPYDKKCNKNIYNEINNIKLSKQKINFNSFDIDRNIFLIIVFVFVFINIYFISGYINYKIETSKLKQKKEFLKKYNLPLTSYQLNAIYKKLKKTDIEQKTIRKDLEYFSKTPLNKNEEYKKLAFNKNYTVEIKTSKNLHNFFSKHFIIKSETFDKNLYKAILSHE